MWLVQIYGLRGWGPVLYIRIVQFPTFLVVSPKQAIYKVRYENCMSGISMCVYWTGCKKLPGRTLDVDTGQAAQIYISGSEPALMGVGTQAAVCDWGSTPPDAFQPLHHHNDHHHHHHHHSLTIISENMLDWSYSIFSWQLVLTSLWYDLYLW